MATATLVCWLCSILVMSTRFWIQWKRDKTFCIYVRYCDAMILFRKCLKQDTNVNVEAFFSEQFTRCNQDCASLITILIINVGKLLFPEPLYSANMSKMLVILMVVTITVVAPGEIWFHCCVNWAVGCRKENMMKYLCINLPVSRPFLRRISHCLR